ncbi:MAG TPA: NAD(P)/FAD-dependent oxidoreductase [Candidatus Eisenbergiella merdipullorum]|uniref:NAD(P)/FAD-dependent oxidoreductase n=1 Tax=Candidatus Eisenbergiella merdipullorum TaxID=2838553 RepID=A0A9D2L0T6_9FIRM|nr:NAD(P)/FAD-dependent oxidoreductase [Candidatus Eisenbergiella merdipullorum]
MRNKMKEYPYPHLFSPIIIGGKRFRNRVVASAQASPHGVTAGHNGYDNASEYQAQYMGLLARGGAAVVNTGHYGVDPRFQLGALRYAFNFFNDRLHNDQMPVLNLMSDNVHAYGALASIELNHGGHMSTPFEGNTVLGPMDRVLPDGKIVVGMDRGEMERVAEYFANAARIARLTGFDIINVHAAHNWLLGQFLSPLSNQREDEFGGSPENRARFPQMVLKAIREAVGKELLISVRYSVAELVEGGATLDDSLRSIRLLSEYADIIHCSAGKVDNVESSNYLFPSQYTRHGVNTYLAGAVKERMPELVVETIGAISDPQMADRLIADGTCDLVAMARSFIADNDWAKKAHEGHADDIRPCIRCLRCLSESVNFTGHRTCSVNPRRVLFQQLPPSEVMSHKKKVLVAGGGPAGLQAANELALKGHEVILCEKSGRLGGRLEYADHVSFKEDIVRYREYLIRQVNKRENITVYLNKEVTPELIEAEEPDALVVAVGAKNFYPEIPGAHLPGVMHCCDLYGQEDRVGDHVVIIGGGMVGSEATIHLHSMDKAVDLVEMSDELMSAEKMDYPDERDFTLYYVNHPLDLDQKKPMDLPEKENVHIHLGTRCVEIKENGVYVEDKNGTRSFLEADTVILATGLRPDQEYLSRFEGLAQDVLFIGDCKKPGTIYNTSTTGYYAAVEL